MRIPRQGLTISQCRPLDASVCVAASFLNLSRSETMVYTLRHAFENAYAWNSLGFVGRTAAGGVAAMIAWRVYALICDFPETNFCRKYLQISFFRPAGDVKVWKRCRRGRKPKSRSHVVWTGGKGGSKCGGPAPEVVSKMHGQKRKLHTESTDTCGDESAALSMHLKRQMVASSKYVRRDDTVQGQGKNE